MIYIYIDIYGVATYIYIYATTAVKERAQV
jgi:hypothetical protein